MGLMAGYGVQLWPILQDIHQLRDIYTPFNRRVIDVCLGPSV
jgi:type IV secretory pathway TraG/TraD family ATPase VirD4